jgi:excisionase family DNA binding protein
LYPYDEAAELLGVSGAWLRKQVTLGTVPYRKLGHMVRFSESDLEAIANLDARQPGWKSKTRTKARGRRA